MEVYSAFKVAGPFFVKHIHILFIFQGFDPTGVLSAGPGEVELSVQPLARDHEAYTLTITPANIKLSAGGLAGKVTHPPIIRIHPPSSNWSNFNYHICLN
jgi:hypothetical protein